MLILSDEMDLIAKQICRMNAYRKYLDVKYKQLVTVLRLHIGKEDDLYDSDGVQIITYKGNTTNAFNMEAFKLDHEDLYNQYCEDKEVRRFLCKQ